MSTLNDAVIYINNNTFIPHENGNYARYGLNLFGCDSVIQYNNEIWKFIWFVSNSSDAVFINTKGQQTIINKHTDGITRMQAA
jgi:hypothetical protein